jgi:hypothetical protein
MISGVTNKRAEDPLQIRDAMFETHLTFLQNMDGLSRCRRRHYGTNMDFFFPRLIGSLNRRIGRFERWYRF